MKTKSVPALITLFACFIACLAGIRAHMGLFDFMKMLLVVLIAFYIVGCVVKVILDKNFPIEEEKEPAEGEEGLSEDGGEGAPEDGEDAQPQEGAAEGDGGGQAQAQAGNR